ncbi:MAG: sigma-70 family RNA polymerase sigma factor [Acidobacteriia bacterium]|nr:sigma-70 family RNA polymerase sigma factor [Terriglobia bacterium]
MSPAPKDDSSVKEPCNLSFDGLRSLADEVVIAHLQAGHGDALGVLFDRYHRLVLHVALKILRDVGEAEDVMQNVFMEIYKVAAQFDPARGTTKMWILRYAYHRSMNRRKQLQVRHFYASTDIAAIEDTLPMEAADISASYEAREVIQRGLQALSPVQNRVLQLAYFEGLTMKEIADETGESLGNVRHHYYRGLDKLRDHLSEGDQASEVRVASKELGDAKA